MTSWNAANSYSYGPFNETWRVVTDNEEWIHLYTADDERLFSWQVTGGTQIRWTLRGLDQRVLREFHYDRATQTGFVERDNIYRGKGPLLAAVTSEGDRHFHVDHLGTPRQITDATSAQVAFHTYFPYGEEATSPTQNATRYKFTGHERDLADPTSTADDLDYMHARISNPQLGRFLSVDPALVSTDLRAPQSWNRYAYARGNPAVLVDRDGRAVETAWDAFNVSVGVASLLANIAAGNVAGAAIDVGGLALDIGATAVPFVPGGASSAIKATRLAANARFGRAFENAVLNALDLSKNARPVVSITGTAEYQIPDAFASGILLEIKGVKKLRLTEQVKDFLSAAEREGRKVVFAVTNETKISKPIQELLDEGRVLVVRFTPK